MPARAVALMSPHNEATRRNCRDICERAGVPATDTNLEQVVTLMNALIIFDERNAIRGDGWREAGMHTIAILAQSKSERMKRHEHNMRGPFVADEEEEHINQIHAAAEDDALDLINYGAFLARQATESWNSFGVGSATARTHMQPPSRTLAQGLAAVPMDEVRKRRAPGPPNPPEPPDDRPVS